MEKNSVKMNEGDFRGLVSKMIKESLSNFDKNMLKEDAWDTPYFIDKVIKSAYKLRHQIHNVYNQCDYGDFDNAPKKGLAQPSGYNGADGKIEKLLYDAYYSINRLIKDLKAASAEFVKEMNDEMYGDEEGGLDQIDTQENVPPTMNESQLQKVIAEAIVSVLSEREDKFFNDEDEIHQRKQRQQWAGTLDFHKKNDAALDAAKKRVADRKSAEEKRDKELKRRPGDFRTGVDAGKYHK